MATATSCENAYNKVLLDVTSTRHLCHVPFGDFNGLGRDFHGLTESVPIPENKSQKKRTKRSVTFSEINCELLTRVDQFQFNRLCTCNPNLRSSVLFSAKKRTPKKELLIAG